MLYSTIIRHHLQFVVKRRLIWFIMDNRCKIPDGRDNKRGKCIEMKSSYAVNIEINQQVVDFFMVKSFMLKTGKSMKEYLDINLGDSTGEFNAKKWTVTAQDKAMLESLKTGSIIKIKGLVTEFNGSKQVRIEQMRMPVAGDPVDMSDYIKAAPEDSEDMYDYIIRTIESFEDEDLKRLCLSFYEGNKERLMYYPAAMRNHHAEYGGLLYHVKRMLMSGERLCEVYTNISRDLLLAGVVLHDIEKLNEILSDENGVSPGYSTRGQLLGHLVMGVASIEERAKELGVPEEKALMLEHMSLSHHYEPDFGSPKKPVFPEAELLHYLDMMDAKMFDFEDNLRDVAPGEFSDKVFSLDNRRLYKRTF